MPKIKIFLWQICHNAVPVRGTLLKRELNIDAGCPLCLDDIESIDHLFSECQIGKKVWDLADKHQWFPLQSSPEGYHQLTEVLQMARSSRNAKLLQKFLFSFGVFGKKEIKSYLKMGFLILLNASSKQKRYMMNGESELIYQMITR